jgi:hypothetical protein
MFYCTQEEKEEFLRRRGFSVEKRTERMAWPVYHDDMEYEDVEVLAVLDGDGKPYRRPGGYNFKKDDWLDAAFNAQVSVVFKEVVLGIREDKAEVAGTLDTVLGG